MVVKSICPECKTELKFDRTSAKKIKCPCCGHIDYVSGFPTVPPKVPQQKPVAQPVQTPFPPVQTPISPKPLVQNQKLAQPAGKVKVICPHCCAKLRVSASYPADKPIECPNCQKSFYQERDTVIIDDNDKKLGSLVLIPNKFWYGGSQVVNIKPGVNTLGRKASTCKASIALPTSDEQMSRLHAKIVMTVRDDSVITYEISDAGSKNGTYLKGDRIEPGDVFYLENGDTIQLGNTEFTFYRGSFAGDETL